MLSAVHQPDIGGLAIIWTEKKHRSTNKLDQVGRENNLNNLAEIWNISLKDETGILNLNNGKLVWSMPSTSPLHNVILCPDPESF